MPEVRAIYHRTKEVNIFPPLRLRRQEMPVRSIDDSNAANSD